MAGDLIRFLRTRNNVIAQDEEVAVLGALEGSKRLRLLRGLFTAVTAARGKAARSEQGKRSARDERQGA